MKMYHILLTVLAAILTFSIAEAHVETRQLINGLCKKTADMKYCSGLLLKNLKNTTPSNKDLMNVTVTVADKFASNTYFFISTLLRNAGDERPKLQQCASAYAIVNFSFSDAVSSFNNAQYSELHKLIKRISKGVGICKTDFSVPGYKVNPLLEKNRKIRTLVDMTNVVFDKLHL